MRRMQRMSLIGLVLVLAMIAAACSSETEETTTTTAAAPETTVTTTTVAEFDLVAAVDEYLTNIPQGFLAIKDTQAFKDGVEASGALVIDVRETSEYEEGHIPGAVNIPLRTLAENVNLIPTDRQVYVYCKSGFRAAMGLSSLGMLGYDNVLSYAGSWKTWTADGEEISTEAATTEDVGAPDMATEMFLAVNSFLTTIPEGWLTAGDAAKVLEARDAGTFILDVRTADEYAAGHIDGATNVGLRTLAKGIETVPTDVNVIAHCKAGHRAAMAVAALHVLDRANVKGYSSSYQSLVDAGAPIVVP